MSLPPENQELLSAPSSLNQEYREAHKFFENLDVQAQAKSKGLQAEHVLALVSSQGDTIRKLEQTVEKLTYDVALHHLQLYKVEVAKRSLWRRIVGIRLHFHLPAKFAE